MVRIFRSQTTCSAVLLTRPSKRPHLERRRVHRIQNLELVYEYMSSIRGQTHRRTNIYKDTERERERFCYFFVNSVYDKEFNARSPILRNVRKVKDLVLIFKIFFQCSYYAIRFMWYMCKITSVYHCTYKELTVIISFHTIAKLGRFSLTLSGYQCF